MIQPTANFIDPWWAPNDNMDSPASGTPAGPVQRAGASLWTPDGRVFWWQDATRPAAGAPWELLQETGPPAMGPTGRTRLTWIWTAASVFLRILVQGKSAPHCQSLSHSWQSSVQIATKCCTMVVPDCSTQQSKEKLCVCVRVSFPRPQFYALAIMWIRTNSHHLRVLLWVLRAPFAVAPGPVFPMVLQVPRAKRSKLGNFKFEEEVK